MTLHELYDQVCRQLEAGEPVPLDLIAGLQAEGYVFPKGHLSYDDDEEEDWEGDIGQTGISPTEVTVSFVDYNHDTDVSVTIDEDGDYWLRSNNGNEILLSPAGAKMLLEILAEALDVYVEV